MRIFALLLLFIFGQQSEPVTKICKPRPDQLMNDNGKPVRLSSKEIKSRIVHCEVPKIPGLLDAQAVVATEVLIDPDGKVECARAISTSNRPNKVIEIAEETAKKWTFKPVEVDGKVGSVYGVIAIHISWKTSEIQKTCEP